MKIAALTHTFPRYPGDRHAPFVKRLMEELANRGHEVAVLVPHDPELRRDPDTPLRIRSFRYAWPDRLHLLGYSRTLHRDLAIRLSAWLESPLYFAAAERALARLVREQGIEVLHAHWILPNGWIAARVARAAGVPFVASIHGSDVFVAGRNPAFRRMARRALTEAAAVTSCSGELAEKLLAAVGPEAAARHGGKITLLPYGTDFEAALSCEGPCRSVGEREAWGLAPGDRALVAVGRLVDKKGFEHLLDALPAILARCPEARLVIGGGGDLEGELRARAAALGVGDRVIFTGPLSHPEALRLIAAADAFAVPSVRDARGNVDGLPNVVLEAMAAGRPLVATRVSGIPLAVEDGVHGLLVPPGDAAALARAVVELLADPERARVLGEAARERVRGELNWAAVARRHEEIWLAALGKAELSPGRLGGVAPGDETAPPGP